MGVESIELDTVNLRMVARTLPGKQFEVGRRLRVLVVRALRRAGIAAPADGSTPMVEAIVHPSTAGGAEEETQGHDGAETMTSWFKAKLGRMRVSTAVLIVAFIALFWVHETSSPNRRRGARPAVVPPGFVPDPNYTWVPRTNVQAAQGADDDHHDDDHDSPTETTTDEPHLDPRTSHADDDRDRSGRCRSAVAADETADAHNDVPAAPPRWRRTGHADSDHHGSGQLARRNCPATLACRDDHPRPCVKAVQVVGAPRARQRVAQDRQG